MLGIIKYQAYKAKHVACQKLKTSIKTVI